MSDYLKFLAKKAITDPSTGLVDLPELPDCLFPHQRDIAKTGAPIAVVRSIEDAEQALATWGWR